MALPNNTPPEINYSDLSSHQIVDGLEIPMMSDDDFTKLKGSISTRFDAQHLGNKFSKQANRVTGGFCLRQGEYDTNRKINTWYVEKM
jgi:hypothetical protein